MVEILTKSPLFLGISPEDLFDLLSKGLYQKKNYQKGEVVALREDPCNYLMIILKGSVRGEMLDYSGKTIKIEDINKPRAIASAFLFGKKNEFPVDVIANEDSELLFISKSAVIQMFRQNLQFLNNYLDSISNRAQFLSNRIYFLSFKTIKGKLAQYILSLSKHRNPNIVFPGTQQETAEFFGVTRPALARVIGELERDQVIQVKRKKITILDREKLVGLIR
jgi:CRP-like cAMP-binding protein